MSSSVADSVVGRVIDGRYRILSHIADGGMASVYVALDARLDREVAVKIMRPGLAADRVFVERFRSEARSAARLSHPNVVAVYDQGQDGDDVFLAMELVTGKTLREVIHEESPLTVREALAILEPILEALRAAHLAGIIHRDVKPENVIVRLDGEVKVADFGLARAITNQTTTNQSGVLLGTVSYLSPEQVERGVADQRSDVYAAGLLLFEMLTGRQAVTGDTPIQIAYKHVHGGVAAPSTLVPGLPAELDALVAEATAVEPDDRFDSAAALLGALRSLRRSLGREHLDRRGAVTSPGAVASTGTVASAGAVASPGAGSGGAAHAGRASRPREGLPPSAGASSSATVAFSPAHGAGPADRMPDRPGRTQPERLAALRQPVRDRPEMDHTTALPLGQALPRRRRRWPWWLAALLLLAGGGGAGWWFTGGPGSLTVVPTVVGQRLADASAALEQSSLRAEPTEEFSETQPKGTVLRMAPDAGSELAKQATVQLVVSKGKERYAVPGLAGAKANALAGMLSPVHLRLGAVTESFSETVPAGEVISQQPASGTSVRRDTVVDVVVSKGRQPIDVPTVTGLAAGAATAKLKAAGLTVKRLGEANSDTVPAGKVISQNPASARLFRGQPVEITVSKGPVMVRVPNVVGRPGAEAERTLTALGFTVDTAFPFGPYFENLVRTQSLKAGDLVRKGSTIELKIV